MARQKKAGTYLNIYLDTVLSDTLDEYCRQTDRTKTAVVERALRDYFINHSFSMEGAGHDEVSKK